jgi:hypothetical protein
LNGIKKLEIFVQVKGEEDTHCEVSLDIRMSPISPERISERGGTKSSMQLKAVQDRVLALDGEYEVQQNEETLMHRIVFQQEGMQGE